MADGTRDVLTDAAPGVSAEGRAGTRVAIDGRLLPAPELAGAVAVAVAYLVAFGRTWWEMMAQWAGSGEYGHGFLLLPVALWLAWRRRTEPRPDRVAGMSVLGAAAALLLVGTAMAELFTLRLGALVALAGLTLHYAGRRQLRAWWLPFGLLVFCVPLPEVVLNSVTLPLQLLASEVAVALLTFRHVPAALAGNIIFLPGQELFVAEACSGLRSLSALLGITLLIAGTWVRRPSFRALLLVLAVPAALAANALRVFGTGYAVYFMGPAAAEGTLHTVAGAAVFVVALGLVGLAAVGLRRIEA